MKFYKTAAVLSLSLMSSLALAETIEVQGIQAKHLMNALHSAGVVVKNLRAEAYFKEVSAQCETHYAAVEGPQSTCTVVQLHPGPRGSEIHSLRLTAEGEKAQTIVDELQNAGVKSVRDGQIERHDATDIECFDPKLSGIIARCTLQAN